MSKLHTITDSGQPVRLDVVFVHGLDGDWKKTWRDSALDAQEAYGWPQWLGEDLQKEHGGCRVHAFDYPACASGWKGHTLPMFDRAEDFLEELDLTLAGSSRIFFVCHSLGGLMVKKLLSIARDKSGTKKDVLQRTAGILFLGTPHQGSGVAQIVNTVLPKLLSRASVTLEELESSNPDLRSLNQTFGVQASEYGWNIHQFAEGKDTFNIRIVNEHSANSGVGECISTDEDHITLPKPGSRETKVYRRALAMLRALKLAGGSDGGSSKEEQGGTSPAGDHVDVYVWTRKVVEASLNSNAAVREFLQKHAPGLIVDATPGFRLCDAAGGPGFDVCERFESVRDNLHSFIGKRADLDEFEKVLGGLLVMGVDPVWVRQQFRAKTSATVEFPARLDWLPLGDGMRANFLHLMASALADGFARLNKLFGDPPGQADERCLKPIPAEFGGIGEQDVVVSLKAHFAQCVLGPEAAADSRNVADVELAFEQARKRMKRELEREHNPYWATGPTFRDHAGKIRGALGLSDLLLIFPTGKDSEDKVIPRSMETLSELHQIFTTIKSRRASLPA